MATFLFAIVSQETKKKYIGKIQNFFEFVGLQGSIDDKADALFLQIKENDANWLSGIMIQYLQYHKERAEKGEIAYSTLRNYYKPLKLFLETNDIILPWKRLTRGLPRGRKFAADRAPTLEEIQKLVEYPDRRIKAIIFTMCSSGIRLGAWDYLKWSDITPVEKEGKIVAAKMAVYSGEEDQYFTFISSEAYLELKKWMDYRRDSGEIISRDSWLMRDLWNVEKYARGMVTVPKQLKPAGIKRLVERALHAQGIRKNLPDGKRRHEFQADHGFRKFFKTRAEQTMKPINVEILMSHSTGISDSYYRPSENDLLKDYLTAVSELTLSTEGRLQLQVQKQQNEPNEDTKKEIILLKEKIRKIELKSEVVELFRASVVEWAQKQPELDLFTIASANINNVKGLDAIVEHMISEHGGNISGLKESFAKTPFYITK